MMLILNSEQKGKELMINSELGGCPAREAQLSLRPKLSTLSPPPLHGLVHGLPQPILVVADVVMRQT